MADVFGSWVPDDWIAEVFKACLKAPQHNYLFLSKNPHRYSILSAHCKLPRPDNFWFGTTITTQQEANALVGAPIRHKRFLSIEPLLEPICSSAILDYDWIIIGAESGNSREKVIPQRNWIADMVHQCKKWDIPIFMKSSLAAIWGDPLIQQYPDALEQVAT
jgi:protein gp37